MKTNKNSWFPYTMISLVFSNLAMLLSQPLFGVAAFLMAIAGVSLAVKEKKNDSR